MTVGLTRRRFLTITAAAGVAAVMTPSAEAAAGPRVWRGTVLGADAAIALHHPDTAEADRLIRLCLAEVERLERVFSLYRPDSALVRLNRDGELRDPPTDLVRLLDDAARMAQRTGGAFDVTVQPLWQLYAGHFGRPGADPAGPPPAAVAAVRRLVDHRALRVEPGRIAFARPGMAATLNGIAQGYVTDRVAERLEAAGMTRVLVDLGEVRALDPHPDGRPWSVGLADPRDPARIAATLPVVRRAVATSGGYGTRLDPAGRFVHLFDPRSGRAEPRWASVTVLAADATTADALSTALSVLPEDEALAALATVPGAAARLTRADGTVVTAGV
ncbi:FAD:protein FMN transferase [Azospirillum halopraeferens]|uniref:FAD:protein FMN transferase n=1 Tax=Azospirillum halopraeferens TaxID=34010 RepID=UPI00041439D0|nr:FAD:protein FMN transferase [Azospirillum halopraeferens]